MRLLGAILAGGRSSRFGSDKALALLAGKPLIAHVADALRPQVAELIVCGREWGELPSVADRPGPDLGPLAGLSAALHHAASHGFDSVLCAACDVPGLPDDLVAQLAPAPAYVAELPVIGLWPAALAPALDAWLADSADRSLKGWGRSVNAAARSLRAPVPNINNPFDLVVIAERYVPPLVP